MKEIIKKHLGDLEFLTGLKQFREYEKEEANRIVEALEAHFKSFGWMTPERVETIMKNGMLGEYGEFYNVNQRTVNIWIGQYFKQNQTKISTEIQYNKSQEQVEVSEQEKEYWLEVGRENFREKLTNAKTSGYVHHLSEWGVYYYQKFIKKGILIESDYPIENIGLEVKKEMRSAGSIIDQIAVKAKVNEQIWKLFILKMIKQNFDFEPYLK